MNPPLSEQSLRMQKLAGILAESEIIDVYEVIDTVGKSLKDFKKQKLETDLAEYIVVDLLKYYKITPK